MTGSGLLYIHNNLLESINLSNVLTRTAISGPRGMAAANNCQEAQLIITCKHSAGRSLKTCEKSGKNYV